MSDIKNAIEHDAKIAFDHIAIIFNPGSSGDASDMAKRLASQIDDNYDIVGTKASLTPTDHAGHAIELANIISVKYARPLIVSVSGDGGYNEVINGVMKAKSSHKAVRTVVAVAGAGNANDHRRVMRSEPLIDLIMQAKPKPLDLVHIEASARDYKLDRYAHSYIGFGVTPQVGNDLNKHSKSLLGELSSIFRTYRTYAPFRIKRNDVELELDNLLFANINEMAKFVKLDDHNTPQDGKFEVIELTHRSKLRMLFTLIKAAVVGFSNTPSYQSYEFTVLRKLPIQSDGEVDWLPDETSVTVTSAYQAIDSLF